MKRINQYDFYELGHSLHALSDLSEHAESIDVMLTLTNAHTALRGLATGKLLQLRICGPEVTTLQDTIARTIETHFKDQNDTTKWRFPEKGEMQSWWFSGIKNALQKLEHNLSAELRETATYYVERIGGFDTSILVDNADEHLLEYRNSPKLNDIARRDFRSAGRCLAMQLPTASGFHTMRAVESVLGEYFLAFGLRPTKTDMTMNDYLKGLEDLAADQVATGPKPNKDTLAVLREAKDLDRNPLMHPRKTLTMSDAHRLFNMASGVLISLLAEIEAIAPPTAAEVLMGALPEPANAAE